MEQNSQSDFRLKVDILELESKLTAITTNAQSTSSSSKLSSVAASGTEIGKKIRPVATVTRIDYTIHILDTFEIRPNDIEYRAEGNANIVLALPQRCQVLRLPKQQSLQRLFIVFFFIFPLLFVAFLHQVTKSKLHTQTHTRTHTQTY